MSTRSAAVPRTFTRSEYRKDGILQDTEYKFSDGVTIKDYEPGTITRNRSVKWQDFEGDNYRRASKDVLRLRLRSWEWDGETELLEFNTPDAPVSLGSIVLDAVEIPWEETADAPELPEAAREALAEDPERFAANLLQQVADLAEDMRELDKAAGNWRASYYAERDRADKADRELAIALLRIRELEASEGSEAAPRV